MGTPTFYHPGRVLSLLGATLLLSGLTGPGRADAVEGQQAAGAPYGAPASKLQVTGTPTVLSLDAEQVPVQSVLKIIFNQAHAQFTTDNSVVGQVTMQISNQSLTTVLDAVCKQLLLRYHVDAHGIYVFEQDTVAAKAAITHLQDLNAQMRQQLRAMGLSLPEDAVLDSMQKPAGAPGAAGPQGPPGPVGEASKRVSTGRGGGAGGFGGGAGGGPAPGGNAGGGRRAQNAPDQIQPPSLNRSQNTLKADVNAKDSASAQDLKLNYLTPDAVAQIFGLNPQTNSLLNPDAYRSWAQQNGFVFINTGPQKAPVVEILEELGRQSNTRILIDSSVPTGPKFSLQGYITPRPLPEALNVLTQTTRLTWRWLGSAVYVNALPDFQIFFNSVMPRSVYGSSVLQTQQNGVQYQQQQQSNSFNYQPPAQIPLPITNGEKKTP